jgi:hypothetical protein
VFHDIEQEQYLIPYDALDGELDKRGLSVSLLAEKRHEIRAPRKMAFLDACRNPGLNRANGIRGNFDNLGRLQSLSESNGARILNATGRNQFSYEDPRLQHGIFTCALLNAINGEAAMPIKRATRRKPLWRCRDDYSPSKPSREVSGIPHGPKQPNTARDKILDRKPTQQPQKIHQTKSYCVAFRHGSDFRRRWTSN